MKQGNFAPYDSADYLETEEDIAGYLEAVMEEGSDDPAYVAHALGVAARARNFSELAKKIGVSRQGLIVALSGKGNPSFATIMKLTQALGLRLSFSPAAPKAANNAAK